MKLSQSRLILILIFAGALSLRLYGIFWGLPSEYNPNYSYHPDEFIILEWASLLYSGTILDVHFEYGGTLFLSFINACVKISSTFSNLLPGFNLLAKQLFFIRLVLVGVALLTIFIVYQIGCTLYNKNTGLVAAALLAVAPGHVIWAQRVRVDELATLMAVLVFYLAVRMYQSLQHSSQEPSREPSQEPMQVSVRSWVLVGVCVGAATALRGPLLLFSIAPLLAYVLPQPSFTKVFSFTFVKILVGYVATIVIAYIVFSPHSILYVEKFMDGLLLQKKYQSTVFVDTVGLGPIGWQYLRYMLPQSLGWPLYVLTLLSVVWLTKTRESRTVLVGLTLLPYLLLTAFGSWVVVRYTIPLLPFFVLLCAAFLYSALNHKLFRNFARFVLPMIIVSTLTFLLPYLAMHTQKNVRVKVHHWLVENASPGSTVMTLRSYGSDKFNEPFIPTTMKHVFSRYPQSMQCDLCYENWSYDYIVVSDPLLGNLERLQAEYPDANMRTFYDWVKKTHVEIIKMDDSPMIFGVNIQAMYSSHDLNYISPAHVVYQKKRSSRL